MAENNNDSLLQEIQNRVSLEPDQLNDSLEHSKLPLTSGIQKKREAKRSAKKNELYLQILKDHGIDAKTHSQANKLQYEIPPLVLGKQVKSKTPVT